MPEAILAAHGSGAVACSHDSTIVNVDIGGGTCKLAIVKNGAILETAAINVGSRLVAWDAQERVIYIEEAGDKIAGWAGVSLKLGKRLSQQDKATIAEAMAQFLFEFVGGKGLSPMAEELLLTPFSRYPGMAPNFFSPEVYRNTSMDERRRTMETWGPSWPSRSRGESPS